jgi:hypothetical protein
MTSATRRRLAIACVVVLAGMIAEDVRALVVRQARRPCDYRLCRYPRDLEQFTRAYHDPKIGARLANFYFLRDTLRGATITIPPVMKPWDRYFLDVARMEVIQSKTPLVVGDEHVEPLKARAQEHRSWLRRGGSRPLRQEIYVVRDPDAEAYVWAETTRDYLGPILIVPAEAFAAARVEAP